jgi:transposase
VQLFLDQKGISFCGQCGAEGSFSKQRNKHQQRMLMEAVKMAPPNSPDLAMIYDKEKQRGNANQATRAVLGSSQRIRWLAVGAKKTFW